MSVDRWLSLVQLLGSLGTLAALYYDARTLVGLSALGVSALAAMRLTVSEAARRRERAKWPR